VRRSPAAGVTSDTIATHRQRYAADGRDGGAERWCVACRDSRCHGPGHGRADAGRLTDDPAR
jgi:hypothetical protein